MVKKTYSGLCVGGPLAGQSKSHCAPIMAVQIMRPPGPLVPDLPMSTHPEVNSFEYQHVEHFYVSDEAGGVRETVYSFWVPTSERHPRRYVLEELARAYAEKAPPTT